MNNIYDNGCSVIGNVQELILYFEKHGESEELTETIINDLKELRNSDYEMIVMINYDNPMGYSIDYWDSKDKMEVIL